MQIMKCFLFYHLRIPCLGKNGFSFVRTRGCTDIITNTEATLLTHTAGVLNMTQIYKNILLADSRILGGGGLDYPLH